MEKQNEKAMVDLYNQEIKELRDSLQQIDATISKPVFPQWMLDAFGKNEEEMQALWEDCQRKEQEKMQLYEQLFNNNSHRFAMTNSPIMYHYRENDVKEEQNED